jgi:hypothetical protein
VLSLVLLTLAAAPQRIVVAPFTLAGADATISVVLEDALAQALRKRDFEVITRQEMSTLLGVERQRQLLGCSGESNSCLAELTNALGCELTVVTSLAKVEGGFRGVVRVMSTTSGQVKSQASLSATTTTALIDSLDGVANELVGPLKTSGPSFIRWVPGIVGVLAGAAGAAFFAVAGQRYDAVTKATSLTTASPLALEGKTFQALAWTGVGVGVVGIVWTGLWLALNQTPPPVALGYSPQQGLVVGATF